MAIIIGFNTLTQMQRMGVETHSLCLCDHRNRFKFDVDRKANLRVNGP